MKMCNFLESIKIYSASATGWLFDSKFLHPPLVDNSGERESWHEDHLQNVQTWMYMTVLKLYFFMSIVIIKKSAVA